MAFPHKLRTVFILIYSKAQHSTVTVQYRKIIFFIQF